jgi:hypothetical protein
MAKKKTGGLLRVKFPILNILLHRKIQTHAGVHKSGMQGLPVDSLLYGDA